MKNIFLVLFIVLILFLGCDKKIKTFKYKDYYIDFIYNDIDIDNKYNCKFIVKLNSKIFYNTYYFDIEDFDLYFKKCITVIDIIDRENIFKKEEK